MLYLSNVNRNFLERLCFFLKETDFEKAWLLFIDALENPQKFLKQQKSPEKTDAFCIFLGNILSSQELFDKSISDDWHKLHAKAEKLFEILAIISSKGIAEILSCKSLYRYVRADNFSLISEKYGVDSILLHYMNIRYSGVTILGTICKPLYGENGRHRPTMGLINEKSLIQARQDYLGSSPYVFSEDERKLYYYGEEVSFDFRLLFSSKEDAPNKGNLGNFYFYFRMGVGQDGLNPGEVDFKEITLNFRDYCSSMCPFCWRAYPERLQYFGKQAVEESMISPSQGISKIRTEYGTRVYEKYGKDVIQNLDKVWILDGGSKNEEEELLYLENLIEELRKEGFSGQASVITSFIRTDDGFNKLKDLGYSLEKCFYPLDCFTRRDKALSGNRQSTFDESLEIMKIARNYYKSVIAFLLVGLCDNLTDLEKYLKILFENGIRANFNAYYVYLARQKTLLCEDIVKNEMNNGHLEFYLEAAIIAKQYGIERQDYVANTLWHPSLDKYIFPDSPLFMGSSLRLS